MLPWGWKGSPAPKACRGASLGCAHVKGRQGLAEAVQSKQVWDQQCWEHSAPNSRCSYCTPVLQPPGRLPGPLSQGCATPTASKLVCPSQSSGSTTQRCTAGEELQEKPAASKETSPPAQPALVMRQSKASITWRHIPVDGARTSQGRTAQSYPSPFSNRPDLLQIALL